MAELLQCKLIVVWQGILMKKPLEVTVHLDKKTRFCSRFDSSDSDLLVCYSIAVEIDELFFIKFIHVSSF